MKKLVILVLLVSSMIAGCSGGGSAPNMTQNTPGVPTPPAAPMVKVRFVNATPRLGAVSFTMGTQSAAVAPREASAFFSMQPGPVTVTVSNGNMSAMRTLTISGTTEVDVTSNEFVPSVLDVSAEAAVVSGFDQASAAVIYRNYTPGFSLEDVYVVPSGSPISGIDPAQGSPQAVTKILAPGTYSVVVAPAGKKTILYQSTPLTLAAGQQVVLLGAPQSQYVLTPLPLVLGLDTLQSLGDARPAVKMLQRIDSMTPFSSTLVSVGQDAAVTIAVDGDVVVQMPSAAAAEGATYHLTPGFRSITETGPVVPGAYSLQVDASASYITRFGWDPRGPFLTGNYWMTPYVTPDDPTAPDRARVRLVVENNCGDNQVSVDGAPITYGSQVQGNAGVGFDHAAGAMQVAVSTPDGANSEGIRNLTLGAGRYYVIRVFSLAVLQCSGSRPIQRTFEISED
ncbi:MAG: hypothetical protein WA190_17045 [Usitatibacter sp.]